MLNQDRSRQKSRIRSLPHRHGVPKRPRSDRGSGANDVRSRDDDHARRRARVVVVRARERSGLKRSPGELPGPHSGKGPKGYRRDDSRIREDICDLLLGDSEVDASEIVVSVADGEVTFDGTVSDRGTKHYVECIGAACLGVTGVQNNLRTPGMRRRRAAAERGHALPGAPSRLELDSLPSDHGSHLAKRI